LIDVVSTDPALIGGVSCFVKKLRRLKHRGTEDTENNLNYQRLLEIKNKKDSYVYMF